MRKLGRFWALCLVLALTACGARGETVQVLRVWDAPEDGRTESAAEGQVFRVGMVTDVGGIDDHSFNQSAWEGLEALAEETGAEIRYIESGSEEEFSANFETLAREGCALIWGVGFSCADALLDAARNHPDIQFAIVDSAYDNPPENVSCVLFRAQDASFLAGYVAAAVTQTKKVGFVGGVVSEAIDQFQYGYQAGVDFANQTLEKDTVVMVEYADSFSDPAKGSQLALTLYAAGCDIVYHAAGGTGSGVISAAERTGRFAIGVDRDQAYLAPDNVLTSALKKVNVAVRRVCLDYMEHRTAGTYVFGLAEGAVGLPEEHPNYSDEIYDEVLRVADAIIAGRITPPSSAEEYARFSQSLESGAVSAA